MHVRLRVELRVFVQEQYRRERPRSVEHPMEEEHRFQRENECQNDRLVPHRVFESEENDERLAKLIVEEIEQKRCNQLDCEYELFRRIV